MEFIFYLLSLTIWRWSYALVELGVIQEGISYDNPKLLVLDNIGLKTCARKCLYHKSCYAFNYNTEKLVCALLKNGDGAEQIAQTDDIFSDISTWTLSNDACFPNPCKENEECIKTKSSGFYCRTDASLCAGVVCQNGGTCSSEMSSYQCRCPVGYTGTLCQNFAVCDTVPCLNSGTCQANEAVTVGYTCTCPDGYYGENCQYTPCSSAPCHNKGVCAAVGTSVSCTCEVPFTGTSCESVPCSSSTCIHGTCQSNVCVCNTDYSGIMCDLSYVIGIYLAYYNNNQYVPMGPYDAGVGYTAVVRLHILDSQLNKDLLQVFDGNDLNAPLLATRSGTELGCDVYASGRYVYLLWTTDGSVNTGTGFTFRVYKKPA